MMRAIAIAATVVMCAACAGQDQQSDGVGAPKATPAGFVDMLNKEINAAIADPKPTPGRSRHRCQCGRRSTTRHDRSRHRYQYCRRSAACAQYALREDRCKSDQL
jgi:hypothetical protein